ncbi:MAG: Putative predicted metal-dependent hydrolase [uncultured Campylobacterales bacterium]|uniref:Predicted metal-dependent hydrolase n=1 Tax=uncultured Campylobacterales bacterium TaxID=352960 RepID=A0A6S6TJ33_9BACT|nr:MAG: Putative predicted metal-dependent hydrolase [uncultured Campylobacterales bacterium]
MNYQIIRKPIKNIYIRVTLNDIIVSAPKRASMRLINKVVQNKKEWIEKRVQEINQQNILSKKNAFYLGQKYNLEIIASDENKVGLTTNNMQVYGNKDYLENWYKNEAKKILPDMLKNINSKTLNKDIKSLKIRKMKTRWGSCNHTKRYINLNSELIKKPTPAIEYVILHELAHLIHPNHSKEFYSCIESFMPDYKQREKLLRNSTK